MASTYRDDLKRRDVVTGMGSALALAAMPFAGCRGDDDPPAGDVRIAIVGGGIAGVLCAYRLEQGGATVTLYEASDRLGGRMFTGRDLYPDGQVCELGGELIDTNHATLWALSEEFSIQLDDRQAGPYAALEVETFWIDGAAVDDDTLLQQLVAVIGEIQADFDAAENDDAAYAALDVESLTDWLERRVPIAQYRELHVVLDVAYRGEYGLENDQQSALNLIYLLGLDTDAFRIFGDSDERYHTHLGNDTFVTELAARLSDGAVALEHRLVAATGEGPFELTFETPDGELRVEADKVVFALPFSILREVDTAGLALSDEKREIIDTIGYGTNAKVMAGFERPVWREDHGASGAVTTDLPFQQSWDTSLGQDGATAILTNFLGGQAGLDSAAGEPEDWVTTVLLPGLDEVHPGSAAAYRSGSAVRMHWPTVPTQKGSYTCYQPGQWAFWSLEGEPEGDLHFCGEHTSPDFQGWMEGGAESGERVATEILDELGLELPDALLRRAALQRLLPPIPRSGRRNALRLLRARREVYAAWGRARRERLAARR
ncbi:flavin monoamine oxidase family protein [Paraliomyxa miuraensis]|uniref:flavin monoamine oxidase family protein n=1 Tax=Paraliomyxa miuraensis TaxID=376150 RepID=UPI0022517283|nr:FAD-dependent oxidoreductase [Paraliomyxa miuraensis]